MNFIIIFNKIIKMISIVNDKSETFFQQKFSTTGSGILYLTAMNFIIIFTAIFIRLCSDQSLALSKTDAFEI